MAVTIVATKTDVEKRVPPVVAFRTLKNFWRSLSQGIPSHVDRSVMPSQSGAGQTQIIHALRYLGLVRSDGSPTSSLTLLVKADGTEFQKALRDVLTEAYPFLANKQIDLTHTTMQQLEGEFKKLGASGDTIRKCITFFIPAAKEAGIPLSPFITKGGPRRAPAVGKPRKQRSPKVEAELPPPAVRPPSAQSMEELLLSKFPTFDPSWPDEVKSKWFDNFTQLMARTQKQE
jgi:hypothetical protein